MAHPLQYKSGIKSFINRALTQSSISKSKSSICKFKRKCNRFRKKLSYQKYKSYI